MAEQVSPKGYLALKKQTTPLVAAIPNVFVPMYKETLTTELNLVEDTPVYGNKFRRLQTLQGIRSHGGDISVLGEPNSAPLLFDMLLSQGTITGAGPYTVPFTLSNTVEPNFYTVDISTGEQVMRFIGCGSSSISPSWDDNKMKLDSKLSALASFLGREIASVSTTVVTLKTDYDPAPTTGLVVGDLVRIRRAAADTTSDFTIASLTATTVTLNTAPATVVAGDWFYLRPATVSLSYRTAFLFSRTQYLFSTVDAATALASTHVPLESGSDWEVKHDFKNADGEKRSGSFDPASLVRTTGDVVFKPKRFFDTKQDLVGFNAVSKRAVVIRHFSEAGYELRITLNDCRIKSGVKPTLETDSILYSEMEYVPNYSSTDGQGFDVKVLTDRATV